MKPLLLGPLSHPAGDATGEAVQGGLVEKVPQIRRRKEASSQPHLWVAPALLTYN